MKKLVRNILSSNVENNPSPVLDNRIYYAVVEGGHKPESKWITQNCSENVFDENTREGYLVLNEGVTTIECPPSGQDYPNMFDDSGEDSNIATVVIPTQITSIGEDAFAVYTELTSVTIPDSVINIKQYAFRNCSGITSITIPDSVETIGNSAFSGCSGLTSITIPNSVTSIGDNTFRNCSGLTSASIGNLVESIGNSAFNNCSSLASVTIGNSVTSIDNSAFYSCNRLASVTCFATTPPTLGTDVFYSINTTTCSVPKGCVSAYQVSSWSSTYGGRFTTFTEIA